MILNDLSKKMTWLPLIIIVILASVRIFIANYLPILGDGAYHAFLTESIMLNGELPSFSNYPTLFHLESAIMGFFAEYKLFPAISGTVTIIIAYLFTKEIIESETVAMLVALLAASHPFHILFSSVFFMESVYIFFSIITMYSHIKYLKSSKMSWLVLTGIFMGSAVATKQINYLLPIVILLQHFIIRYSQNALIFNKKNYFEFISISTISFFVATPFLYHFYLITGTILDPTNPLSNFLFFRSNIGIDPISSELIYHSGIFKYSHLISYTSLNNILYFYIPSTYYIRYAFPTFLFLILFIMGSLHLIYEKKYICLYLLVPIVLYHYGLTMLHTQKYFIILKLIILIPVAMSCIFMKKKNLQKYSNIIILFFIIIPSSFMYINGVEDAKSKYYSMGWLPTEHPITNLIDAYSFIEENSNINDKIADPNYYEAMYYTKRTPIWLRPWEGGEFYLGLHTHDETLVKQTFEKNNIKYIVIILEFVSDGDLNTLQFISLEDHLFIKNSPSFELAFKKEGVEVYEYKY